jgi:hypothetical protein
MAVPRGNSFVAALEQATKRSQELDRQGFSDTVVGGDPNNYRYSKPNLSSLRNAANYERLETRVKNDPVDYLPPYLLDDLEKEIIGGDW